MEQNLHTETQHHQIIQPSPSLFHQAKNGIDITFQNISYKVKVDKNKKKYIKLPWNKKYQEKTLLNNVSGIFKAGKVSAIMGASGAGKTTLLNILSCRIHHQPQGKLYANNLQYTYDEFGEFANYVMQADLLMQTLTVRETLMFAIDLKVNGTNQYKKHRVNEIADQLKLQKCIDTLVGGVTIKGISGGQKKRTNIAFELLSDPQVIFLDEPTSGLDSLTSFIIVSFLRKLTKKNKKTVIMTIHQPNTETYELFDDLLLLVEGRVIYQGPADRVIDYFTSSFNLKCPTFMNPPDFFMSKIHHQSQENRSRYPVYMETYETSIKPQILRQIQERSRAQVEFRKHETQILSIYGALLKRNFLNTIRNPLLMKAKVLQGIFLSLFAGGVFFGAGKKDLVNPNDWRYYAGCLFFVGMSALTTSLSPITITFPIERPIFLKEQDSKMYTVWDYSIARFITDLPELIIVPIINSLIIYFMIGLSSNAQNFFIFVLTYVLIALAGSAIGLLIGSLIQDAKSVAAFVPIIMLPIILFSGFFKNRNDLPKWIGWLEYISPIKYGFIAFIQNEVGDRPSRISQLQFDLSMWPSIFILLGLGMGYRLVSVFFLAVLRKKTQ